MTLWTGGQGNSSLIDWGVWIHLCLDAMNAMTGCAGGRISPTSGSKNSMNAFYKLFGDIRMT